MFEFVSFSPQMIYFDYRLSHLLLVDFYNFYTVGNNVAYCESLEQSV